MSDIIWGIPGDFAPETETFTASQLSQHEGWGQKERDLFSNWTNSQGEGVLVIVLDTIFDHNHPDLPRPFWSKNYARSTNRNMHGWHVGGIIGAINNDFGVVGVAPKATLGWGAVLSDGGSGSTTGIHQAVRDITNAWKGGWKNDFVGCVINLSLGGPRDPNGQRVYDEANDAGICVVAATGNSGANAGVDAPGHYISTVGVASYRSDGNISNFSSGGREVDFAFPGEQIMSTVPGGRYQNASGTCIKEGEFVYGPNGPKAIEQIVPGDVVFAWKDGELVQRVVYQNHYRGTADTILLKAAGRDVRLTPTHQVMTINKSREFEWVEAQHLTKGEHTLLLPKKFENVINPYLDALIDADFAWLLGFFAGDGWLSHTTRGMRSCFASGDKPDVINKVKEIYEKTTGKCLKNNQSSTWHYDDSTMIAMVIKCLGLHEKAHTKNVPMWLWNLPKSKQLAFYEGYLSADGNRAKTKLGVTHNFETVSPLITQRLAALADYWGVRRGSRRTRERFSQPPNSPKGNWTKTYCLNVNFEKPLDGGWSRFHTNGKTGEERASDAGIDTINFYTAGTQIDDTLEQCRVYDLTVPDADCFVTSGIITHNSMSTPFCAGVAALIMSSQPHNYEIKNTFGMREYMKKFAVRRWPENRGGYGVPTLSDAIRSKEDWYF